MYWRHFHLISVLVIGSALSSLPGRAQESASGGPPPLIPRAALFSMADRLNPQVSPDGSQISFIGPVNGVPTLWVAPAENIAAARPVLRGALQTIRQYYWSSSGRYLLYLQDRAGDENEHLYRLAPATGEVVDLVPVAGVKVQVYLLSPKCPDEVLIGVNDRNPEYHDIYRLNVETGNRTVLLPGSELVGFVGDDKLDVRLASTIGRDRKVHVARVLPDGRAEPLLNIPPEDQITTQFVSVEADGKSVLAIDSRGREHAALTRIELKTGHTEVLYEGKQADVSGTLVHPTEKTVQAVAETHERCRWIALDPAIRPDLDYLRGVENGDFTVPSRSADDRVWIVGYSRDDAGVSYYRYDHLRHKATLLFRARSALKDLPLASMRPVVIKARDGLPLVSYLTLPVESAPPGSIHPSKPLPLVLYVHGGPWARDTWGYSALHQWLANRGYAVLSVNFRGSLGFGKKLLNAGNQEWAGKMHTDLLDAVDWAVKEHIAIPSKVAIAGSSYGGYAALVGLTFTPDRFACAVDVVGPSNLLTLVQTIPEYWGAMRPLFAERVGDPTTPEGRQLLISRSPITKADRICRPLLIGQGANDPRVTRGESDRMVRAIKDSGLNATYVVYPDEGHGFNRPENLISFYALTESFLGRHLGGRVEPIGDALRQSTAQIVEDAGDIRGLRAALADREPAGN